MNLTFLIVSFVFGFFLLPVPAEDPQPDTVTLYFQNGDFLTGEAIELNEQSFEIQSGWGEKLSVPRVALTGWTLKGHGFGSLWNLDRESIQTVMTKEPGMEAPLVWDDEGRMTIGSPQYMVFSHRFPEQYRSPLEIELTVEFPSGKPGLDLFIVPDENTRVWGTPSIMVRMAKNKITCLSYISDKGNRDARYTSKFLPQPNREPITILLRLDPEQNTFVFKLNGEEFLSWQEPEEALPPGFSFKRLDWKFTGNVPVIIHQMSVRLAGIPPDEEERIPPFVELANGDILISKSIRWDEKGLWLERVGVPPFAIPPQRAASVWLANPTPLENASSIQPTLIKTQKGQSLLTLTVQEETEETTRYLHPAIPDPISVPK